MNRNAIYVTSGDKGDLHDHGIVTGSTIIRHRAGTRKSRIPSCTMLGSDTENPNFTYDATRECWHIARVDSNTKQYGKGGIPTGQRSSNKLGRLKPRAPRSTYAQLLATAAAVFEIRDA